MVASPVTVKRELTLPLFPCVHNTYQTSPERRLITSLMSRLSKTLSKAGLTGPEKRSLAPFAASFTRSIDLFDFVDAGELEDNAGFKIRATFRQFVENAQCRHIYFAAAHDVGEGPSNGSTFRYHVRRKRGHRYS